MIPVDRRTFLSVLVAGALIRRPAAEAQPTGKVWRIGVLEPSLPAANGHLEALRAGVVEGRGHVACAATADDHGRAARSMTRYSLLPPAPGRWT